MVPILLYGFADILTSQLVLDMGGVELNPILSMLVGLPGGFLWFIAVKIGILIGLILLSLRLSGELSWVIPLGLAFVGTLLTVNNLLVLL